MSNSDYENIKELYIIDYFPNHFASKTAVNKYNQLIEFFYRNRSEHTELTKMQKIIRRIVIFFLDWGDACWYRKEHKEQD